LAARYHYTVAEIYETELLEFEEVEGKLDFSQHAAAAIMIYSAGNFQL